MRIKTPFSSAFTLPELLITISVVGILLGVAIPSFDSAIKNNLLTNYSNEFITSLNFARTEAIKRGQHVVVRKTSSNWENGWHVFVDIDRSTSAKANVFDAATDVQLKVYPAFEADFTLRGNNNFVNFIRYQPNGTSNQIGSFIVCHNGQLNGAKLITVNTVGRTRIVGDIDNNGVPEKDDGIEISSCTITSGF
jgi:prepilin-type N-terminal cleavage/methylation domain